MGKVKSKLMEQQDDLFEIVDLEDIISESESFEEFASRVMIEGGDAYYNWAANCGIHTERFIITDLWNESWS